MVVVVWGGGPVLRGHWSALRRAAEGCRARPSASEGVPQAESSVSEPLPMVPEVSRVFPGLVRRRSMVPDERGPRFLPAGQSQGRTQPSPAESVEARPEAIPDRSAGEAERARTGPSPRAVRPRGSKNPELARVFSDPARRRVRRARGKPICSESSPIASEFPFAGPNGDARTGRARIRPKATEPGRALRSHPKAEGAGCGGWGGGGGGSELLPGARGRAVAARRLPGRWRTGGRRGRGAKMVVVRRGERRVAIHTDRPFPRGCPGGAEGDREWLFPTVLEVSSRLPGRGPRSS